MYKFIMLVIFTLFCLVESLSLHESHICYKRVFTQKDGQRRPMKMPYCCDGYIADDTVANDRLVCNPICMPGCVNGTCTSPGVCECNPGYKPNGTNHNICHPACSSTVPFSKCIAPETLACNHGYKAMNQTCQPVCTEPCLFGTCTAPETCDCFPGFRIQDSGRCAPYCSRGCDHGKCIAPDECDCDEGWVMTDGDRGTCAPDCNITCTNGVCEYPNTCKCNEGYHLRNDECVANEWKFVTVTPNVEAVTSTISSIASFSNETGIINDTYPLDNVDNEDRLTSATDSSSNNDWAWIVLGVIIAIVLILLITLIVVKWKWILELGKGNTYDVEAFEAKERKPKNNIKKY